MKNLEPSTTYFYVFGNEDFWSKEAYFRTSSLNNKEEGFKFVMYGDMGIYVPGSTSTVDMMMEESNFNISATSSHFP